MEKSELENSEITERPASSEAKKPSPFSLRDFLNWAAGIIFCALGCVFCTKAHFGLSMIAAIPYTLHLWLRDTLAWFTQGTAEYCVQATVLIVMCLLIRKFRPKYLLAFGTAVLAGFAIDGWIWVFGGNMPFESLPARIVSFVLGVIITAVGVAFFFHTDWPLQVYELLVAEFADTYKKNVAKVKLVNDIIMLVIAVGLSFLVTGTLTGAGVGVGTIVITFVNSPLIALFGKLIEKYKL